MLSMITTPIIFMTSFLVILSVLVFIHELGHYSVARFFNVAVDRFSIGMGKPALRWKAKSGTEWTISRLPIGGYVRFMGDAGAASNPDLSHLEAIKANIEGKYGAVAVETCFHFKPLWQRTLIVLAGPIANFLLAIVIFASVVLMYDRVERRSVVVDVIEGSAAEAAGVQVGDQFLTLNGKDVSESTDFIGYVMLRSGVELEAKVKRGSSEITFPITPRRQARRDGIGGMNEVGTVGVQIGGPDSVVRYEYNPITALGYGTQQLGNTISMTGTYVKRIFQGRENGKALGGPLRIATMTGKVPVDISKLEISFSQKIRATMYTLLTLAAALSVGLGVANLMPIPALDGGHLLYYGYEALAGRPLSETKQEFGFRIGLALLLTALVFLTINDIGYIRSMLS